MHWKYILILLKNWLCLKVINVSGRYFVVSQDCPYEKQKWTLYTERGGFQEPEFGCQSVREMQRYLNEHGKELARATEPPTVTKMPKKEAPTR